MGDRDLIISQIRQRLEILYQMVEELENQPGPGPGPGTSDYDDLSNKPSINDVELSGNKTAAQLGLATSSSVSSITSRFEDLITPDNIEVEDDGELPSSIDSRLALHQPINLNHTVYYFYDESGVDYNYFAVDTSGAYPKLSYAQIFKENKRVHFYDYATDTVPASNSDNFITSGGVYTALASKADSSSVYTKTEVDTALASKQNSLDTAQLNAVNSGITSSKVAQYDKDAAVLPEIVNSGAKNLSPVDSGTNGTARYAEIAISIPAGTYIVYCGNLTSNDTDSTTCLVRFYDANGTQVSTPTSAKIARGNGVYITLTISNATDTLRIYPSDTSALSENDTVSFTGLMVCTKAAWDVSQAYAPYTPTLQEFGTWEEYECFYPAGGSSYFDSNASSVKVKVNRALKRCVADISLAAIASIDTSTNAFNFGTLSAITNNTEIRPKSVARTMAVSKADNYTAVISKPSSTATLSIFVSSGTIANGTSISAQLSWDFA